MRYLVNCKTCNHTSLFTFVFHINDILFFSSFVNHFYSADFIGVYSQLLTRLSYGPILTNDVFCFPLLYKNMPETWGKVCPFLCLYLFTFSQYRTCVMWNCSNAAFEVFETAVWRENIKNIKMTIFIFSFIIMTSNFHRMLSLD